MSDMIAWIGDTFSAEHSDKADRERLILDLKHNPHFVVKVLDKRVRVLVEDWVKEHPDGFHLTSDDATPDAFKACAKKVTDYLHLLLKEELSGIST